MLAVCVVSDVPRLARVDGVVAACAGGEAGVNGIFATFAKVFMGAVVATLGGGASVACAAAAVCGGLSAARLATGGSRVGFAGG